MCLIWQIIVIGHVCELVYIVLNMIMSWNYCHGFVVIIVLDIRYLILIIDYST